MVDLKQTSVNNTSENGKNKRKYVYPTLLLLTLISILAIVTISGCSNNKCFPNNQLDEECSCTSKNSSKRNTKCEPDEQLKIVSRIDWGAIPTIEITTLKTPVPYVIILHTTTRNCTDKQSCSSIVRIIQNTHKTIRRWWDVGYNFLIGDDGNVYEGRGWEIEGAFVRGYNSKAIGIAFIGNFNEYKPENKSINAAKMLIEQGVQKGYIVEDYNLYGQRQFVDTLSPGEMLFDIIKKWPHWNNKVD